MSNYCKNCYELQEQLDQLNAEQNIIKAVCENHFDEYEMGCLNLSEAIESLLERYDNAITGLMKDRKELRTELEQYKDLAEHNGRVCNERLDKIDELEHDINELLEQLEAYKMEAEEGKEINAELKVENEELKEQLDKELQWHKSADEIDMINHEYTYQLKTEHSLLKDEYKILEDNLDSRTRDFEDVIDVYKQTLTEIKELLLKTPTDNKEHCVNAKSVILQKISECEGKDDSQ